MVYSPNGRQIAIGAKDGIYLWDLQSEEPSAKLEEPSAKQEKLNGEQGRYDISILCIAYSPCGQWIASSYGETVKIWHRHLFGEVERWSQVYSICSFFLSVDNVAWSPVVPMELVTGCRDGSVRVWRVSHDDGANIVIKMLWASDIGILYTESLVLEGTIDLSPVNQKLLIQRGITCPISNETE